LNVTNKAGEVHKFKTPSEMSTARSKDISTENLRDALIATLLKKGGDGALDDVAQLKSAPYANLWDKVIAIALKHGILTAG
jgi:hypothetical protein